MKRHTRFGEKRGLESPEVEDGSQPEPKRPKVPALASVIVEALKVDSLQKLCSSLEPILRKVVSEEVERALAKLGPARIGSRSSPKRIEGPDGRNLQLYFKSMLSLPLFTGGKVEGEQGAAIHVVLVDASSGHVVTSEPESSAKLDVVVLEGDFNNEDDDGWTKEEFESHVVKEREGKRPILTGDLQVSLKEGVGTLGELTFTDNSSWIRCRKFRLGLRVAPGFCEGVRVREAKTEAFVVKDHRGELYKKHYPPALKDEVWRLEKIGKDGSFHKKLNAAGIYTVEDFLRLVVRDPQKLRNTLGSSMSNKMWETLVEHAKTCVLSGKLYVYYSDEMRNLGAIFNHIFEFSGLIVDSQYFSAETLSDSQKVFADSLLTKAYDNWNHVVEYDGNVLLNSKESSRTTTSVAEGATSSASYSSYDQQLSLHRLSNTAPEQTLMDPSLTAGGMVDAGYDNQFLKHSIHSHHVSPDAYLQSKSTQCVPQDHYINSLPNVITRSDSTSLALGPSSRTNLEFQPLDMTAQPTNLNSYDDDWLRSHDHRVVDDILSEDEIRMRSHEMLENEDMQQLLRVLSMGGVSANLADDNFSFPSYMPTPLPSQNCIDGRNRSGKAVVGWLKIKAAMRWGIFIRKKAAERRAQIVELED